MRKVFLISCLLVFVVVTAQPICPAVAGENSVIAEVNGETIDEKTFNDRIRTIHKYKPGMRPEGGAGQLSVADLVEDMIDERLMIQEALRVELDKSADFKKKMASFIATQSILRLRREVVIEKIDVNEEEINDYFKEHYQKGETSEQEISGRSEKRIRKSLRKEQEKKLSDDFVSHLKDKADIQVDWSFVELLDSEKPYEGDKSEIGRVNGKLILIEDFVNDLRQATRRWSARHKGPKAKDRMQSRPKDLKKDIVEQLIKYELIEQEALKRNYLKHPDFAAMVKKRKKGLLSNAFKAKLVYPLAVPTENELTQYYNEHIDDFKQGYEVWIRNISFKERKEAEKILQELKQGADFEYLVGELTNGGMPRKSRVWVHSGELSSPVRSALRGLKVGEVSDVIADGKDFKIVKLKGRRGGEPVAFSKITDRLKKLVGRQKFDRVLSEYLAELRKASEIKINEKVLKQIKEKYWKDVPVEQGE
ncbi:MAG: hypothetical protein BBJ60_04640 [Desulfobacterales bacterium S7086C20]|nr:MAG: hypothetical protein BBJ60_04640 [Desulfobacterales bacterium S7086C20]